MKRDILALSWSQLTPEDRRELFVFLFRRLLGGATMVAGMLGHEPAIAVVGAALYLDARLRLR